RLSFRRQQPPWRGTFPHARSAPGRSAWSFDRVERPLLTPRERDDFVRRLAHGVGRAEVQATLTQQPLAFLDVRAFHANHNRDANTQFLHRAHAALGESVAATDAAA